MKKCTLCTRPAQENRVLCITCAANAAKYREQAKEQGLCSCCRKPNTTDKSTCSACSEMKRNQSAERRKRNREAGLCNCGNPKTKGGSCSDCVARRQQDTERLRAIVCEAYGGCCTCCGENNKLFLTVDHKNNDGSKHRQEVGSSMYRWIVKNNFPETLQLLCYNCNCGRARNGGVCPHHGVD